MDIARLTTPLPSPRGQRGFTLIEIMVVVVILGILAAMVVPKVLDRPDQARATAAKQDIGGLMQALKLYRLDHGSYPNMTQGLKVLVALAIIAVAMAAAVRVAGLMTQSNGLLRDKSMALLAALRGWRRAPAASLETGGHRR